MSRQTGAQRTSPQHTGNQLSLRTPSRQSLGFAMAVFRTHGLPHLGSLRRLPGDAPARGRGLGPGECEGLRELGRDLDHAPRELHRRDAEVRPRLGGERGTPSQDHEAGR